MAGGNTRLRAVQRLLTDLLVLGGFQNVDQNWKTCFLRTLAAVGSYCRVDRLFEYFATNFA